MWPRRPVCSGFSIRQREDLRRFYLLIFEYAEIKGFFGLASAGGLFFVLTNGIRGGCDEKESRPINRRHFSPVFLLLVSKKELQPGVKAPG